MPPPPQGMANTARKNFGGGNTAWEEKTLSKYESRWVPKNCADWRPWTGTPSPPKGFSLPWVMEEAFLPMLWCKGACSPWVPWTPFTD